MTSNKDSISVEVRSVDITTAGVVLRSFDLAAVRKLVIVQMSNALFQGDEPFFVIFYDSNVVTVPFFTPGIASLISALASTVGDRAIVYRAECDHMPLTWRKRYFGILPLFPIPRLACHAALSIPQWTETGPFSIRDISELAQDLNDDERKHRVQRRGLRCRPRSTDVHRTS